MRTFLIKYSYCNLKHENQFKYGNYICINKFFYSNNMISENKYCCNFAIALPPFSNQWHCPGSRRATNNNIAMVQLKCDFHGVVFYTALLWCAQSIDNT